MDRPALTLSQILAEENERVRILLEGPLGNHEQVEIIYQFLSGYSGTPVSIKEVPVSFVQAHGTISLVDFDNNVEYENTRTLLIIITAQHTLWRGAYSQAVELCESPGVTEGERIKMYRDLLKCQTDPKNEVGILYYLSSLLGEDESQRLVYKMYDDEISKKEDSVLINLYRWLAQLWMVYGQMIFAEISVGCYQKHYAELPNDLFIESKGLMIEAINMHLENPVTRLMLVSHYGALRQKLCLWKEQVNAMIKVLSCLLVSTDMSFDSAYAIIMGALHHQRDLDMNQWVKSAIPTCPDVNFILFLYIHGDTSLSPEQQQQQQHTNIHYDIYMWFLTLLTMLKLQGDNLCLPRTDLNREEYMDLCFAKHKSMYAWILKQKPQVRKLGCLFLSITEEKHRELESHNQYPQDVEITQIQTDETQGL